MKRIIFVMLVVSGFVHRAWETVAVAQEQAVDPGGVVHSKPAAKDGGAPADSKNRAAPPAKDGGAPKATKKKAK